MKTKAKIGDRVVFTDAVRCRLGGGYTNVITAARGVIVAINGPIVAVDFQGTWLPNECGGTVRHVPHYNLDSVAY